MLLVGQSSFFELNLLNYSNPSTSVSVADRNLLQVAVRSGWQHHRSVSTAAIIYTYEIDLLIKWLRHLHKTGRPEPRLLFSQPSLSIECLSAGTNEYLLQVKLAHDVAPVWHHDPYSPFWLPVVIPKLKVAEAVRQLEQQFSEFPVRW
ncbi:WapI family immunity protein [Spirosoma oryzicola]|uniref:WapI family immunity protein n=1 Tax=Spirosoma oryzicola TaxID=2898794 RepID=UPI001E2D6855|nr:hypothetical protein [Spirosoma oryzicola]UHG92061.1 hypothetical protein LQ777_03940 [Spirosoma oryzicola]